MTLNVQNAKKIGIGGSKNLFDKDSVEIGKNYNGAVGTVAYPFNNQSNRAAVLIPIEASTTYNFSMANGSLYLMEVRECDSNYVVTRSVSSPSSNNVDFNFTTQSNGSFLVAKFKYGSAGTESVTQAMVDALTLQLEKGSTATTYEPYVAPSEVRAIHDKDNRLLWGRLEYDTKYEGDAWQQTYTGKNLFDKSNSSQKLTLWINTNNNTLATSTSDVLTAYVPITAGETYTVSKMSSSRFIIGTCATLPANNVAVNDIVAAGTGTSATLTASAGAQYLVAYYYREPSDTPTTAAEIEDTMQIELGSTVTAYEPYVGGIPAPNPSYPQDIKVVDGPQAITVRGKNKFSFNAGDAATGGNVSQTHTDNSVHLVATGTTGAQYYRVNFGNFNPNKSYWISFKGKKIVKGIDGQPRLKLSVYYSDNGTSWSSYQSVQETDPVQGQTYNLSTSFTGHQYFRFYFYNNGQTPVTVGEETEYWDIQVEEGNATTTFEAFQAKTVSTDLRGVNLMPMDSAIVDNDVRVRRFKMGLPAGTYTVSYNLDSFAMGTNNTFGINLGLAAADSGYVLDLSMQTLTSGTALGRYSKTFTIAAPVAIDKQSDVRVAATYWTNGARASISNIQIEPGDNVSTYQPYHAPYELKKVSGYADYLYKDGNDWKLKTQVGLRTYASPGDSLSLRNTSANNTYTYSTTDVPDYKYEAGVSVISKQFRNIGPVGGVSPMYNALLDTIGVALYYGSPTSTDRVIYFNSNIQASTLLANGIDVYYPMATPTDTVITDAVLIEKLNSIHDWLNRYGYHADVVGDLPIVINQESL